MEDYRPVWDEGLERSVSRESADQDRALANESLRLLAFFAANPSACVGNSARREKVVTDTDGMNWIGKYWGGPCYGKGRTEGKAR